MNSIVTHTVKQSYITLDCWVQSRITDEALYTAINAAMQSLYVSGRLPLYIEVSDLIEDEFHLAYRRHIILHSIYVGRKKVKDCAFCQRLQQGYIASPIQISINFAKVKNLRQPT